MEPISNTFQRDLATSQIVNLQSDNAKAAGEDSSDQFCFYDHMIIRALETERVFNVDEVSTHELQPAH